MNFVYLTNFEQIDGHGAPMIGISEQDKTVSFKMSYDKTEGVQLSTVLAFVKYYLENFNENLVPKNQEDINTIAALNEAIMWVNKKHGYTRPVEENHHA